MTALRSRLRRWTMVASAALLVLTCAAWVRSERFKDTLSHWQELDVPHELRLVPDHAHWRHVTVELAHGALYVQRGIYAHGSAPAAGFKWSSMPVAFELFLCSPATPDVRMTVAGFAVSKWERFPFWRSAAVRVPLWSIASASSIMPAIGLITSIRRRRRFGAGCCPSCGYDLRATPQRCPECGQRADAN